jgi:hypothetical protein
MAFVMMVLLARRRRIGRRLPTTLDSFLREQSGTTQLKLQTASRTPQHVARMSLIDLATKTPEFFASYTIAQIASISDSLSRFYPCHSRVYVS